MAASRVAVTSSRSAAAGAGTAARAVRVSSSTSRARAVVSSLILAPSAASRRSAAMASSRDRTPGSDRTRRLTTQAERVGFRSAVNLLRHGRFARVAGAFGQFLAARGEAVRVGVVEFGLRLRQQITHFVSPLASGSLHGRMAP